MIRLQDEYRQEERNAKGIVTLADILTIREQFHSRSVHPGKVSLWQGDITRLEVGAIVNAANSQMLDCFIPCHRCIDNAIHSAAGMRLREKCNRIMGQRRLKFGSDYEEPTGTATLTPGYNLPCDHVIHTVGPIVNGALEDRHCRELRSCYKNVLRCCLEHGISSVAYAAFPQESFIFLVRGRQKLPGRRWRSFWMIMAGVSRGLFLMYLRTVMSGVMRGFFWVSIK